MVELLEPRRVLSVDAVAAASGSGSVSAPTVPDLSSYYNYTGSSSGSTTVTTAQASFSSPQPSSGSGSTNPSPTPYGYPMSGSGSGNSPASTSITASATVGMMYGGTGMVIVTGTVTGMQDGASVQVQENGNMLNTSSTYNNGQYSITVGLGSGQHTLTVIANGTNSGDYSTATATTTCSVNVAGNSAPASITAQVQGQSPVNHGTSYVSIAGTVTGLNDGASVSITENGNSLGGATVSGGQYSTFVSLSVGQHTLTVTANGTNTSTGQSGTASTTVSVTVTAGNSTVSITAQCQGTSSVSATSGYASISGTVTGLDDGATVAIKENGNSVGSANVSNGQFSTFVSLSVGKHNLTLTATGTNTVTGNSDSASTTLSVTITAPPVIITAIDQYAGTYPTISVDVNLLNGSSTTGTGSLSAIQIGQVNGATVSIAGGVATVTPNDTASGSVQFQYQLTDGTTNHSQTQNVTVYLGSVTLSLVDEGIGNGIVLLSDSSQSDGTTADPSSPSSSQNSTTTTGQVAQAAAATDPPVQPPAPPPPAPPGDTDTTSVSDSATELFRFKATVTPPQYLGNGMQATSAVAKVLAGLNNADVFDATVDLTLSGDQFLGDVPLL